MSKTIPERYRSQTPEQALAHLAEELAEATQAAAKSLRWGLGSFNPELPMAERRTNAEWLHDEMGDVQRAWIALNQMMEAQGGMPISNPEEAGPLFAEPLEPEKTVEAIRALSGDGLFKKLASGTADSTDQRYAAGWITRLHSRFDDLERSCRKAVDVLRDR